MSQLLARWSSYLATGCLENSRCTKQNCSKKHDALLHPVNVVSADVHVVSVDNDNPEITIPEDYEEEKCASAISDEDSISEFNCNLAVSKGRTCLHVVPVRIKANGAEMVTYALLDTGSDVSLCSNALIKTLGIKGQSVQYNLNTLNSKKKITNALEVSLSVSSYDDEETIHLPKVWSVEHIPVSRFSMPTEQNIQAWDHLSGISFPRLERDNVDLLIGGDVPEAFWTIDQRIGRRKEPYAVKTLLGWALMGPLAKEDPGSSAVFRTSIDEQLSEQLKSFWTADFAEIGEFDKREMSCNDKSAVEMVKHSTTKTDGN